MSDVFTRRPRQSLGLPVILVVVAVVSLLAAYALTYINTSTTKPSAPTSIDPDVNLVGFYGREVGPYGLAGQWMSDTGTIELVGDGKYWLALQAASNSRPRAVRFASDKGDTLRTLVLLPRPGTHIIGPFEVSGSMPLRLSVAPPAKRPSRRDTRLLAIFVGTARLVSKPLAALPSAGFYPEESTVRRSAFSWFSQRATIDVVSLDPALKRAWVTLVARPFDANRGSLNVRTGKKIITTVPSVDGERIVVGPVPLTRGRGKITLSVPRPVPTARDGRRLSFRVDRVTALDRAP